MSRKLPLSPATSTEVDWTVSLVNPDGTQPSATNPLATTGTPNSNATTGVAPSAVTVASSSRVLKASAGNLYGFNVTSGASAGYVLVYNLAAPPADGTVTPVKTYVIAANASLEVSYNPPRRFSTGCVVVFSTTGPFTQTLSATAFISGDMV